MEYEEKYFVLRDENTALKKLKNEQELTIKRMYTKLAMIEENMKRKSIDTKNISSASEKDNNTKLPSTPSSRKRDLEAEKFIKSLKKENTELKKRNNALVDTNRKLQKKLDLKPPTTRRTINTPTREYASSKSSTVADLENLVKVLRSRLVTAEKQVVRLRTEQTPISTMTTTTPKEHCSNNFETLENELRERQAQLNILRNRYENLEQKSKAERDIQERTLEQMETFNRTIRELRRQNNSLSSDNDQLSFRLSQVKEMEEDLLTLRAQNLRLEERMTSLCESPFINDAFQKKERVDRMLYLEKAEAASKVKMTLLQEKLDDSNLQISKLKAELSETLQRQAAVTTEAQPAATVVSPAVKQDSPIRGDALIISSNQDPEILVSANHDPAAVDFLESSSDPSMDVKTKLRSLQVVHLSTLKELERTEKMLAAQVRINRDTVLELEELSVRKSKAVELLENKLDEFQSVAASRLARIKELEKSSSTSIVKTKNVEEDTSNGENIIECWIKDAVLNIPETSCTCVMLDFYDFESQSTPLIIGKSPVFDFCTSFKVDDVNSFCQFISEFPEVTLELHAASASGDFVHVGSSSVNVKSLILEKESSVLELPVNSTKNKDDIGMLRIAFKFNNKALIKKQLQAISSTSTNSTPANQESNSINVTVSSCVDLKTGGVAPSPYVHYKMLNCGSNDDNVFTPIVQKSFSPVFDHESSFELPNVTPSFLRSLTKDKIIFTVFNDDALDEESLVIGTASVSLRPLVKSEDLEIQEEFNIISSDTGIAVGRIRICVNWKDPRKILCPSSCNNLITFAELSRMYSMFKDSGGGGISLSKLKTFTPSSIVDTILCEKLKTREIKIGDNVIVSRKEFKSILSSAGFKFRQDAAEDADISILSSESLSLDPPDTSVCQEEEIEEENDKQNNVIPKEFERRKQLFLDRMKEAAKTKAMAPTSSLLDHHSIIRPTTKVLKKPTTVNLSQQKMKDESNSILSVEQKLMAYYNESLLEVERKKDLVSRFSQCSGGSNELTKAQFAHALRQEKFLSTEDIQSLIQFFFKEQDSLNYNLFLQFINYKDVILPTFAYQSIRPINVISERTKTSSFCSFEEFSKQLLNVSTEAIQTLMEVFDLDGTSVANAAALEYLLNQKSGNSLLSMEELQQVAFNYMTLLLAVDPSLLSLKKVFHHYDLLGTEVVPLAVFTKIIATSFPLTLWQATHVGEKFSTETSFVEYKKFIQWSTPPAVNLLQVSHRLRRQGEFEMALKNCLQEEESSSRKEIVAAMRDARLPLHAQEIKGILHELDPKLCDNIMVDHVFKLLFGKARSTRNIDLISVLNRIVFDTSSPPRNDLQLVNSMQLARLLESKCHSNEFTMEEVSALYKHFSQKDGGFDMKAFLSATTTTIGHHKSKGAVAISRKMILRWIEQGIDYRREFESFDRDYSGILNSKSVQHCELLTGDCSINYHEALGEALDDPLWSYKEELRRIARQHNHLLFTAPTSREEFYSTLQQQQLFSNSLRSITFENSCRIFDGITTNSNDTMAAHDFTTFVNDAGWNDVLEKCKRHLDSQRISRKLLEADVNNDLHLSFNTFKSVLEEDNIFSQDDLRRICTRYDLQKSNRFIAYKLFLLHLNTIEPHNPSENITRHLINAFDNDHLISDKKMIYEAFVHFAGSNNSTVTIDEFMLALRKLGITEFNATQISLLFDDDCIPFKKWLAKVYPLAITEEEEEEDIRYSPKKEGNLIRVLEKAAVSSSLRKSFEHYDINHNGSLSLDEFKLALKKARIQSFSSLQIRNLAKRFPSSSVNEIDYNALLEFLSDSNTLSTMYEALCQDRNVWQVFEEVDYDRSGVLSLKQVRQVFKNVFHFTINPSQCTELEDRFGVHDGEGIDYRSLLEEFQSHNNSVIPSSSPSKTRACKNAYRSLMSQVGKKDVRRLQREFEESFPNRRALTTEEFQHLLDDDIRLSKKECEALSRLFGGSSKRIFISDLFERLLDEL